MTDIDAAAQFIAGHARLLERRRFAYFEGDGSAEAVLRALEAYRNADGGLGHLEPDLRTPTSQPSSLLYALEILHEVSAPDLSIALGGLDWLETITHDDGGIPFLLPSAYEWPHAPWWDAGDGGESSLLMTAGIAAMARRLGLEHPWIERASAFCWQELSDVRDASAYTLRYAVDFLDSAARDPRAMRVLDQARELIPDDGLLRVSIGAEGEALRPLDLAPRPDHLARSLYGDEVIERELTTLAEAQQPDGGWTFTWLAWNPAAELEWRGVVTVNALRTLREYGRLPAAAHSG
jgi:hypothetical protein